MAELSQELIQMLNDFGPVGLKHLINTGTAEVFRNYMIHNFGWFKGNIIPHSPTHRRELAWYRFYIDHGRIPNQMNLHDLASKNYTQLDFENLLDNIATQYAIQHGYDVLNPTESKRITQMILSGF